MKAYQFSCEWLAICLTRTRFSARVVCITMRLCNCNLPKRMLLLICVDILSERPNNASGCTFSEFVVRTGCGVSQPRRISTMAFELPAGT